jgi:rubrerythrin
VIHDAGLQAVCVSGRRHAASMRARTLLRDTDPEAFLEAVDVVGRPDRALTELGTCSNLRVAWQCRHCGHLWEAPPAARAAGRGCPSCAVAKRGTSRARAPKGKALSDLFPDVSAEFVRNETRPESTPDRLRPGSHQKCQWRCGRCGYEWVASVANRLRGRGCRICASTSQTDGRRTVVPGASAADKAPGLVAELVGNLTSPGVGLQERRPASTDRCVWRCEVCGHSWEATIVNRVTKGSGCPPCSTLKSSATRRVPKRGKSLADTHPHLVQQLVTNLSVPGRTASQMPARAADRCRWRCNRSISLRARSCGTPELGVRRRCQSGCGDSQCRAEVADRSVSSRYRALY